MKWIKILQKGQWALLQSESDTQYVVVNGYDPTQKENSQWNYGFYFTYQNEDKKVISLIGALELFRDKIEENYIPRTRLEELAILFKDGLISDDRESAIEYFNEVCEMTDEEKEWFGIEETPQIKSTKFENPMYNKGYDDGFSDAINDKESE